MKNHISIVESAGGGVALTAAKAKEVLIGAQNEILSLASEARDQDERLKLCRMVITLGELFRELDGRNERDFPF